jgi:hypothetical protein
MFTDDHCDTSTLGKFINVLLSLMIGVSISQLIDNVLLYII